MQRRSWLAFVRLALLVTCALAVQDPIQVREVDVKLDKIVKSGEITTNEQDIWAAGEGVVRRWTSDGVS